MLGYVMNCFTVFLVTCLVQSSYGTEPVRTKRQTTGLVCDEGSQTQINTTFLYTYSKTCSQLIGEVADWYNDEYIKECTTWLRLDGHPTDVVSDVSVFECSDRPGGQTKYRVKICCEGKPNVPVNQLICFTCKKEPVLRNRNLRYYHTQHCNHYGTGPQICALGEVCAAQLSFNSTEKSPGLVSKSCMPASDCQQLEDSNEKTCQSGFDPHCTYCYNTNYGNYDHPLPLLRAIEVCAPNPCHNNGRCERTGTGDDHSFICHCPPGTAGDLCEQDACDSQPCQHDGACQVLDTSPYYSCICYTPWTGALCNKGIPLCETNWCENGGTCYNHSAHEERCVCPDGYVGKRCEFKRPFGCSKNAGKAGALRTTYVNVTWSDPKYEYDCTYWNDVVSQSQLEYYRSYCYRQVPPRFDPDRPEYRPGSHGEKSPHQEVVASSCTRLNSTYTKIRWQFCCAPCDSNPCQNGGWCINNGDSFACRCRFNYGGTHCEKKLSSCYASGDPHYYTFDGAHMHFQGKCKYVLTENLGAGHLPYFKVTTKNEHRDDWPRSVTFPRYAEVEVYGHKVRLSFPNETKVDGQVKTLPYHDKAPNGTQGFSITKNGLNLQFEAPVFGLVVELSNEWTIIVRVPSDAAGLVDGLCRNNNGSPADDFVLPDGRDVTDDPDRNVIIGDHFYVEDPEDANCPRDTEPPPICDTATTGTLRSQPTYCGYMNSTEGPFAKCIRTAPKVVEDYMENCVYDLCAIYQMGEEARRAASCSSLLSLANACGSHSYPADFDWRLTADCVPECPGDLVYEPQTAACRVTCRNPDPAKCKYQQKENCVCKSDTDVVLPNDTCVHASVCGCVDEGRKIGEVWCQSGSPLIHECVLCTDCARPVGKVKTYSGDYPAADCPGPHQTDICNSKSADNIAEMYISNPGYPKQTPGPVGFQESCRCDFLDSSGQPTVVTLSALYNKIHQTSCLSLGDPSDHACLPTSWKTVGGRSLVFSSNATNPGRFLITVQAKLFSVRCQSDNSITTSQPGDASTRTEVEATSGQPPFLPPTAPSVEGGDGVKLEVGAGIGVAILLLMLIAVVAGWMCYRKKQRAKQRSSQATPNNHGERNAYYNMPHQGTG